MGMNRLATSGIFEVGEIFKNKRKGVVIGINGVPIHVGINRYGGTRVYCFDEGIAYPDVGFQIEVASV